MRINAGNLFLVGYSIVESLHCVVSEERAVGRTARERWLTRPWRPWVKTKTIVVQVPSPDLFMSGNTIVAHPVTMQQFLERVEAQRVEDLGQGASLYHPNHKS